MPRITYPSHQVARRVWEGGKIVPLNQGIYISVSMALTKWIYYPICQENTPQSMFIKMCISIADRMESNELSQKLPEFRILRPLFLNLGN